MLIKLWNENPAPRIVRQVVEVLSDGGLVVFPTDTVYGLGCDIKNHKAIEKLAKIKGTDFKKANFSFICYDLSDLSEYSKPINNHIFKIMKKNLPGPFTFILEASNKVPKVLKNKKKTIGIRIPDNNIIREIIKELGNPIMTTSIKNEDEIVEYITDPELIYEQYGDIAKLVIDDGFSGNKPSAIIDCTTGDIKILREGPNEIIL